ncbi:hypothetical protein AB0K85_26850 [Streptomyces cellulosae]|uniref:hypothetical protein n=1 Tax=Streptomyces althioticus TaxID=83380 RepID=UPI0034952FE3|nr:hypothetical protein OG968_00110 [Streptomyces althioticus]WTB51180.1 hypothetical protein OG968_35005 [Streptomyces althioticus]
MSTPSEGPGPSYTKVQLSGPPEAVGRLMAALGGAGQIIFDSRTKPDARGEISCTARVATLPVPRPVTAGGRAEVVMQCALTVDTGSWPGVEGGEGAGRLEEDSRSALAGLPGLLAAHSRVIAVTGASDAAG